MLRRSLFLVFLFLFPAYSLSTGQVQTDAQPAGDPLPSWIDRSAKRALIEFVRTVTDKASPRYVPPGKRIATFDNDGTLWAEQPMYAQLMFALDRVKAMAAEHPDWKAKEPFKAVIDGDREAMSKFGKKEFLEIVAATHAGMNTDQFHSIAQDWLATAKHPHFKRPYTECVYQPMLEVMQYLRANGFKTYIVTGGGQAFVRAFSEKTYGIPPEQVIGSAAKLKYSFKDGKATMMREPALLLLDDEEGKPEDIELFIGQKPLAAFGNSNGDRQMLEWTQSGPGARFMMLIHHDDDKREFSYGAKSKIGTFSDELMTDATKRGWVVTSMKGDWKRVFAFEN
jgi:phosphoglycolate phosphatase-like HAD superfamily hydrolase